MLGDFIEDLEATAPFELIASKLNIENLRFVLDRLTDRERTIIEMRYGLGDREPATLDEVGRHFNVTRERIRQIEAKALAKMRHPSTPGGLRELAVSWRPCDGRNLKRSSPTPRAPSGRPRWVASSRSVRDDPGPAFDGRAVRPRR